MTGTRNTVLLMCFGATPGLGCTKGWWGKGQTDDSAATVDTATSADYDEAVAEQAPFSDMAGGECRTLTDLESRGAAALLKAALGLS